MVRYVRHPTDEHVRVRSGEFQVGMGDALDASTTMEMAAGDTGRSQRRCTVFAIAPSLPCWAFVPMVRSR